MTDIKRRPKYEIVLRAMRNGIEVEMPDGCTYAMVDNLLCVVMKVWMGGHSPRDSEPDEIRYHEIDIPFNTLSKWCDEMSEEEIVGLIFQSTLTHMKEEKKNDRCKNT